MCYLADLQGQVSVHIILVKSTTIHHSTNFLHPTLILTPASSSEFYSAILSSFPPSPFLALQVQYHLYRLEIVQRRKEASISPGDRQLLKYIWVACTKFLSLTKQLSCLFRHSENNPLGDDPSIILFSLRFREGSEHGIPSVGDWDLLNRLALWQHPE